jgi:hypothetical protein
MIVAVQIVRRSVHYAVERPAREVLYTVVPRRTSTRPRASSTPSSIAVPDALELADHGAGALAWRRRRRAGRDPSGGIGIPLAY